MFAKADVRLVNPCRSPIYRERGHGTHRAIRAVQRCPRSPARARGADLGRVGDHGIPGHRGRRRSLCLARALHPDRVDADAGADANTDGDADARADTDTGERAHAWRCRHTDARADTRDRAHGNPRGDGTTRRSGDDEPLRLDRVPLPGPELRGLYGDVRAVDAQLRRHPRDGRRWLRLAPDECVGGPRRDPRLGTTPRHVAGRPRFGSPRLAERAQLLRLGPGDDGRRRAGLRRPLVHLVRWCDAGGGPRPRADTEAGRRGRLARGARPDDHRLSTASSATRSHATRPATTRTPFPSRAST